MRAEIHDHELGLSWTVREAMARSSHALRDDEGGVWLIDPVDVAGPMQRAGALGTPRGVIQLLDRHGRDCAAIAARLGVPHHRVPAGGVEGSPFEVVRVVWLAPWHEVALWWPARQGLVVAESLGTVPLFALAGRQVGLHPLVRLRPPRRALTRHAPRHLLVGHGPPVSAPGLAGEVDEAVRHAARDLVRLPLGLAASLRG